ncbi:ScbR family autoregulator-binding transcription factor [Streptomyces sp. NPDC092296]|uniref:ScbR family autoregulator-binding transcription factor n=1 Tax=Streptomyces sp. NPDC092296 TaxID=3366012 RepID=UPI0037F2AA95
MKPSSPVPGWEIHPSRAGQSPDLSQDRAMRTRAKILLCAAELFAEHGFKGTSVQDVATRIGMTKGAVYFHFPSKDLLAVAVVEGHYARWSVLLEGVRAQRLGALDTAMAVLDGAADAFAHDIVVQAGARLQIENSLIGLPLPTPYAGWIELMTLLFSEAQDAGELRAGVDPAAVARVFVTGFFGMQHVSATLHQRKDMDERWAELRELVLFAVRA